MSNTSAESDSDPAELDPSPKSPAASIFSPSDRPSSTGEPFGDLPRIARRHARLGMRLRRADQALRPLFDELSALLGASPRLDTVDVIPRASGLRRPGAIAQLSWPRLGSRIGLGIEPAIAHAIVDRLLGFERTEPEHRLQVSPVEWGVLGFVVARLLDRLGDHPGGLGPWDLYIDRVGPEPYHTEGLGPIVTLAWPLRISPASGIVRLWLPEVLIALALVDDPPSPPLPPRSAPRVARLGSLEAVGIAQLATMTTKGGLSGLQIGCILPISGEASRGTPQSPGGQVSVIFGDVARRWLIPASAVPEAGGSRLTVLRPLSRPFGPQEPTPVPPSNEPDTTTSESTPTAEVPVTLVVELGRLSLSLARLADVAPGDVLELVRNARDPIDLTSGGTLVARGELIQLDSGLGVRVTRLYI